MYSLLRPLLFALPPETVHALSINALGLYRMKANLPHDPVSIAGLRFPSKVGMAAGFDKDAKAILGISALGASHVEVGTLTLSPQRGNLKPRVFRLPQKNAIINRMGFPNEGIEAALPRIIAAKRSRPDIILGVNIGKNKDTPLNKAQNDYCALIAKVSDYCDYIAVNISSPNTPGLRDLQNKDYLSNLLGELSKERDKKRKELPLFIKIAPDLDSRQLKDTIDALLKAKIDAVIATNTTLDRTAVRELPHANESGGLSGAVLHPLSCKIIGQIRTMAPKLPIIGVGGIDSLETAKQTLAAGANLLQLYTGLIYQGPGLFKQLNHGLA